MKIVATPGTNGGYPRLDGRRLSLVFLSEVFGFYKYTDQQIADDYLIEIELIPQIRELLNRPNKKWWRKRYTEDTVFDLDTVGHKEG